MVPVSRAFRHFEVSTLLWVLYKTSDNLIYFLLLNLVIIGFWYMCVFATMCGIWLKKKDFIYLFLEREEGREKERVRNINV